MKADDEFVDVKDLRPLDTGALSAGGQSEFLTFQLGPGNKVFVYKKYLKKVRESNPVSRLQELLRWRRQLDPDVRLELDSRTAWVRHLVQEDGELVGVLIPPAPDEFWAPSSAGEAEPRTLSALVTDESWASTEKMEFFSVPQTVARLGHLLETINFLHVHNVVIGDLQKGNVLVSGLTKRPATYLVDCDSVLLSGRWTLPKAELDLMRPYPPAVWPSVLNRQTDLYKFALLSSWAIGKDMALLGLDPLAIGVLTIEHGQLIHDLLVRTNGVPPPVDLRTVATVWKHYVDFSGNESVRAPGKITPTSWTGAKSLRSPHADVVSPAHTAVTSTWSTLSVAAPTPPPHRKRAHAPLAVPIAHTPPPRRKRAHVPLVVLVALLVIGGIFGGLKVSQTLDFPLPWDPQPISPVIDPATVTLGAGTVAQAMDQFANVGVWGGNVEISRTAVPERPDSSLVAFKPTRITSNIMTDFTVSYDCSRRQETRNKGLSTESYVIAPGPYLAVSGDWDDVSNSTQSPNQWRLSGGTPAVYVLYSPSCAFTDGVGTGTAFPATEVPAHDTVAFSDTSGNQLVFVLPAGAGTPGNSRMLLSFIWVCDDGTYLVGKIPPG